MYNIRVRACYRVALQDYLRGGGGLVRGRVYRYQDGHDRLRLLRRTERLQTLPHLVDARLSHLDLPRLHCYSQYSDSGDGGELCGYNGEVGSADGKDGARAVYYQVRERHEYGQSTETIQADTGDMLSGNSEV